MQAVGRAIRKSEDKTIGTIVIPVFIDTDEDPEIALNSSAFKPVWDIVKALRAHDEELGPQLDELRRELGRRGGLPTLASTRFTPIFPPRLVLTSHAPSKCALSNRQRRSWEFWFGLLEKFVEADGHPRVPHSYMAVDGYRLGLWVNTQRIRYRNKTLEAERIERLSEIPDWSWHARESKWEEGFRYLAEFVRKNGHARVPRKCVMDGFNLGWWNTNQRTRWEFLGAERQRRLKELPGWSEAPHDAKWEEGFRLLLDYVKENGTAAVPRPCVVDGYPLGSWVMTKRQEFKKGTLSRERRVLLEELPGWSEDAQDAKWEDGFRHLAEYVEKNGHASPPQRYEDTDGYRLGAWTQQQRCTSSKGLSVRRGGTG